MLAHERALGERFLAALPESVELYGLRDDGRTRADVLLQRARATAPEAVATFLAERDVAVWHGDYYAVETMKHLGLDGRRRARRASSTTTPRTRSTACSTGLAALA